MIKPTPGPWEIDAPESDNPLIYNAERCQNASRDNQNWRVAVVCGPAWNTEAGWSEARATANLIAAAPDLLAFCEKMEADTWFLLLSDDLANQLRAALAKARGEEE